MLRRMIDRPVTVTMIMLVVIVLGLVSMRLLPVSLIPDVDIPYITVQVSAPDLSAREIDETVCKPLRQQFQQLSSLEDMVSESRDGSASIELSFAQGTDIDYLFIEVNEKVDRSMGGLGGIERPRVFKSAATDIPAFYINMTLKDGGDFEDMSDFASQVVAKRLEQLDAVAMVDVSGVVEHEILIIPDIDALHSIGLSENDFENYVKAANVRIGSLSIRDGEYRYNVKFQSFAKSRSDIENIYLNVNGRNIQIKDLASVIEHPAKRDGLVRSDSKDAVTMAVFKQSDARMSDLKKGVGSLMENIRKDYPGIDFKVTRDQTELLEYSINNLMQNILVGILLACLIIFLFMRNLRSSALVAFTIPAALIFSMLVFRVIGLSINIISLSGLLLGVGMMVDNTIVLIDNITARWCRGEELRDAVVKGTTEVIGPMLSSVLTTCAVFIPLIFVSGIAGALFYDQAIAVTVVLLTSFVTTVTVIPVYYWCWYRKMPSFRPNPFLEKFSFAGAAGVYEKGIKWTLRNRWSVWGLAGVSVIGVVLCFSYMKKDRLPDITYTDTLLKVDWNDHISLEENASRVKEIELEAGRFASQLTSLVGMQQFVMDHSGDQSVSEALIYMKCSSADSLALMKEGLSSLLDERYPSCIYSFDVSGNIFDMVFASREADIVAKLRPLSSPEVEVGELTEALSSIRAAAPEASVQEIPLKTDVLYVADPEKMSLYNVSYQDLTAVLKNAMNENHLYEILQGDRTVPVVMGVDFKDIASIVNSSFIKKDDYEIPVASLMKQSYESDLKYITAGPEGCYYPVNMEFSGRDPKPLMNRVRTAISEQGDFDVSFGGSWFSNKSMTRELIVVILLAVLLLYLILASQFESLVQPLIILSEIVIDIFGALATLWICGVSINLMSMIGLVVICGIVINDSILKIDTINGLRKQGFNLRHSIMEAGKRRLKSIVMTSLTTILSVAPFLTRGSMGADLQYPMALVIVSGMTIGTLVSLLFVPAVYYAVYHRKEGR